MRKKIRIGVVGAGAFSGDFIRLFKLHPDVEEVALADLDAEKLQQKAELYGITRTYHSLEDMLKEKDIDCIGVFTQRHLHGPMVLQALEAGKHVYSAVPIACTIEEIEKIIEKVKETGLTYMMAETCYYYPDAIFCREKYKKGEFGKFVYGEAQYYHDISEMYGDFKRSGGEHWQRAAGIPPMFYPTHSISMIFSAIDEYATKVSCMGLRDDFHTDEIYGEDKNYWQNPFSNQTAIFRMSGGGVARINEFRRAGVNKPSSYMTCFYGDYGSYEHSITQHIFQRGISAVKAGLDKKTHIEYLDELLNCDDYIADKKAGTIDWSYTPTTIRYIKGFCPIQDKSRLPKIYREEPAGSHFNSHPFLVDDFVRAVVDEKLPPNNAWEAARYMIPGLVAHESSLRDGELLDVPDFGPAPADWARLEYTRKDYYEE